MASLTYTAGRCGSAGTSVPSSGSDCAGSASGRANSVTAGRSGAHVRARTRAASTRATPGSAAARCGRSAGRNAWSAALPLVALRRYRSAGSTWSSQRATPSRKLATITVSATDSARLATTPATATAAASRSWWARRSASSGSTESDVGRRASNTSTSSGTQAMPPTSSSATDRYAATGKPATGGANASSAPAASSAGPGQRRRDAPRGRPPRPLSAWAGARACACRAGNQPPISAAATPSSANSSACVASKRSAGATPGK